MIDRYILEALQKAMLAAIAACLDPDLPVKMVGRNFEPIDRSWLEVIFLPNNIENEFWDKGKTYRGIFRFILHAPQKDEGAYEPMELVGSLMSYFKVGKQFTDAGNNANVLITTDPNFLGPIENAPEMIFPVSIRYSCFKA